MKRLFLIISAFPALIFPSQVSAVNLAENYAFGGYESLGELFSTVVPLGFTLAGIMVTFYTLMGCYDLIMSWGDKNQIMAARNKIIHGIIGMILLVAMFAALRYLPTILGLSGGFTIIGM